MRLTQPRARENTGTDRSRVNVFAISCVRGYDSDVRPSLGPLLATAILAGTVAAAQDPVIRDRRVFRSGIEVTSITATVRDSQGRLVTGLEREAFEVFEDGDPQQVTQFTNERVPIGLGVVLDTSDSMFGQRIKDARAAVERFLFDLLDPGDEYFAMSFNHRPHALTRWTSAPDVMRRALDRLKPNGGTAVVRRHRRLAAVDRHPLARAGGAARHLGWRRHRQRHAAARRPLQPSLRSDAFVYAVAIDAPDRRPINTPINPAALSEITDQSGGRTARGAQQRRSDGPPLNEDRRGVEQSVPDRLLIAPGRHRWQVPHHPRPRARALTTACAPATAMWQRRVAVGRRSRPQSMRDVDDATASTDHGGPAHPFVDIAPPGP